MFQEIRNSSELTSKLLFLCLQFCGERKPMSSSVTYFFLYLLMGMTVSYIFLHLPFYLAYSMAFLMPSPPLSSRPILIPS